MGNSDRRTAEYSISNRTISSQFRNECGEKKTIWKFCERGLDLQSHILVRKKGRKGGGREEREGMGRREEKREGVE